MYAHFIKYPARFWTLLILLGIALLGAPNGFATAHDLEVPAASQQTERSTPISLLDAVANWLRQAGQPETITTTSPVLEPGVHLRVEAQITPSPLVAKQPGQIAVTITNFGTLDATNVEFRDSLPDGVLFIKADSTGEVKVNADRKNGDIVATIANLPSGQAMTLLYTIKATPTSATGVAITNSLEVTANGLAASVRGTVDFLVATADDTKGLIPANGDSILDLGTVSVTVPEAASNGRAGGIVRVTPIAQGALASNLPRQFEISLWGVSDGANESSVTASEPADSSQPLEEVPAEFSEPVELTVSFDGIADLETLPADQVPFLAVWDEDAQVWVRQPMAEIDSAANTVTVETTHFSTWGAGIGGTFPTNGTSILLYDDAPVSMFAGNATYSYPLWVPAGRNGMSPSVALSYSSGAVNGILGDVQSSWVGMGWNIDSMEITRKIFNGNCSGSCGDSATYGYRNDFILALNGASYKLIADPNNPGRYYTEDHSFLYIQRHNVSLGNASDNGVAPPNDTDEWWEVIESDGTRYRLGWTVNSEQLAPMRGYVPYPGSGSAWANLGYAGHKADNVTLRWRVDLATDVNGNTISYDYFEEIRYANGTNVFVTYDRASYLASIIYSGKNGNICNSQNEACYRVEFLRGPRDGDGDTVDPANPAHQVKEWDTWDTSHLDKVVVKAVGPNNQTVELRTYDIEQQMLHYWDNYSNNNWWSRVVSDIIVTGGSGANTTVAPKIHFTYRGYDNRDWKNGAQTAWEYPRLETIENGTGGSIKFYYEKDGRTGTSWDGKSWPHHWRVSKREARDGVMSNATPAEVMTTEYGYQSPCYYDSTNVVATWCHPDNYGDVLNGFAQVRETLKNFDGTTHSIVWHYFKTDIGLSGREWKTEQRNAVNEIYLATETDFVAVTNEASNPNRNTSYPNGVRYVYAKETRQYERQGTSLNLVNKQTFTYDTNTGDLLNQKTYSHTNVLFGETVNTYINNQSEVLFNAPFEVGYTFCANEHGTCTFTGSTTVRYGANGSYYYRTATGSIACNNATFGDPISGVGKSCHYLTPYTFCANEHGTCTFSGTKTVRYGANGSYYYRTATGSITCNNAAFGDPLVGVSKYCHYDSGTSGLIYLDDTFRTTNQPGYATGTFLESGGYSGGALQIVVGGVDNNTITNMSGGWQQTINLVQATPITVSFRYNMTQSQDYENDEYSQVMLKVDGVLYGTSPNDYVTQLIGNGDGGGAISTGWQTFSVNVGTLSAGNHTIVIGGFNNKKTHSLEATTLVIDDLKVSTTISNPYLKNLPRSVTTKDGQGNVLSEVFYAYDGTANSVGAKGQLTLVQTRTLVDATQTINTTYTYDAYGNHTTVRAHSVEGSIGGLPATNSADRVFTVTYDLTYQTYPVSTTNPLGHKTFMVYDFQLGELPLGLPRRTLDANASASITDPLLADPIKSTRIEYDKLGRSIKTWQPENNTTNANVVTIYPTLVNGIIAAPYTMQLQIWDESGSGGAQYRNAWAFYDGWGRILRTVGPAEGINKYIQTDTWYNAVGEAGRTTQPYEATLTSAPGSWSSPDWTHTDSNKPDVYYTETVHTSTILNITTPNPITVMEMYLRGGSTNLRQMTTQTNGRTTTIIDANGHQKVSIVDDFGRLIEVKEFTGEANPYTEYANTLYQYDARNLLTTVTDDLGNVTAITYDSMGRKTSMDDPDMGVWSYAYNIWGEIVCQTDARSPHGVIRFTYDTLGRVTQREAGTSATIPTTKNACDVLEPSLPTVAAYTYDSTANGNKGIGQLTEMVSYFNGLPLAADSMFYDNLPTQPMVMRTTITRQVDVDENGVYDYTFTGVSTVDSLGRVLTQTLPDPDMGSPLSAETLTFAYNERGVFEAVTNNVASPAYVTATNYTPTGAVDAQTLGNGVITDFTYETATNRLQKILVQKIPANALLDLTYAYDNASNIKTILDGVRTERHEFNYDHLDRLTEANIRNGLLITSPLIEERDYTYNAIGNLLTYRYNNGSVFSYSYPTSGLNADRPHAATAYNNVAYIYDANGNMTLRDGVATDWTQTFDNENRLAQVTDGTTITKYIYDGNGTRVMRRVGNTTTLYVMGLELDLTVNVSAQTKTWNKTTLYYPVGGAFRVIESGDTSYTNTDLRYRHGDHLGSTSVMSDSTGAKVSGSDAVYAPFGEMRGGTSLSPLTDFGYTGQRLDRSSGGLIYYKARYYLPELRRFVSADTVIPELRNSQALNRYSYVINNPVMYRDPSGHVYDGCWYIGDCDKSAETVQREIKNKTGFTVPLLPNASDFDQGTYLNKVQRLVSKIDQILGDDPNLDIPIADVPDADGDGCRMEPCNADPAAEGLWTGAAWGADLMALVISAVNEYLAISGCIQAGAALGGLSGGNPEAAAAGCVGAYLTAGNNPPLGLAENGLSVFSAFAVSQADIAGDRTGYDADLNAMVVGGDTVHSTVTAAVGFLPEPTGDLLLNIYIIGYDFGRANGTISDWEVRVNPIHLSIIWPDISD